MSEDVYTTKCLTDLRSYAAGVRHERECPECKWLDDVERAEAKIASLPERWFEDTAELSCLFDWLLENGRLLFEQKDVSDFIACPWDWRAEYRRMLAERYVGPKP